MQQFRSQKAVDDVRAFKAAAIADGWEHEPTYKDSEDESSACRLTRDGFVILTISRDGDRVAQASINAWGPDKLAVELESWAYPGFDFFQRGTRRCRRCGAADVDTKRVGFAGRYCVACVPAARKEIETPGWDN